ncbi:DHS-like NAD/FAD-binding domain-containing protein [Thelonectria olida]|uniref:DHS-like NAD/FAD-binding domain-containing protein n=1 Tax=Thelonectria olida TaxID=1576542 RepID=A0A9P8VY30_9HYPO|nr:DHS-like NAD/FAD-binding domain-containing protein [Thelonectria olida]
MMMQHVTLNSHSCLQDIADMLEEARKVVVMTGAGISTSAGIPDFRSENGLYTTAGAFLRTPKPGYRGRTPSAQDMFESRVFSDQHLRPAFYELCTRLRNEAKKCEPTKTHEFIGCLRDLNKLARVYTQNIDRLEEKVGLSTNISKGLGTENKRKQDQVECVALHGSLHELRCSLCGLQASWDTDSRENCTLSGLAPPCPHCANTITARVALGKRRTRPGYLRPDVVLYGEEHPRSELISTITEYDISEEPDLLLILGTSLKAHGFKVIVKEFAKAVHCSGGKVILVNKTNPGKLWAGVIDYWVEWDCDAWVVDMKGRKPSMWSKRKRYHLGNKCQV